MRTKKKVGIITINDAKPNFGNKLQNYAGVKVFEKLGCRVSTILTEKQIDVTRFYARRILNFLSGYHLSENQYFWQRFCRYHEFDRRYLHLSRELLEQKKPEECYDYFALGSDQVWNTDWWYTDIKKNAFLLKFAKSEQKVCLAPSFGFEELPDGWKADFAESLNTFEYLSVREEKGAEIIQKLIGRKAEVVLDPTLMVEVSEWRKLEKKLKLKNRKKPYILKYFIGDQAEENVKAICELSRKKGMDIYEMLDENDKDLYSAGPREFLYLIDHAELICTDSFHATVFSILFGKPFVVFDRKEDNVANLNSRIDTLLNRLKIEKKKIQDDDVFQCDYKAAYRCLENEKKASYSYLKKSLHL